MVKKILSIDGGGIRGVGPAFILNELDKALVAAGKPKVADTFDLYVGTSTGCILAAGLAASTKVPNLAPSDLLALYYDRGKDMFVRSPWSAPSFDLVQGEYQTDKKQAVLSQILGTLTLGDLDRNFLGTFYSLRPAPKPVFAQGGPQYRALRTNAYDHLLIAEVVNASSNAPIYFDPSDVYSNAFFGVDGGVFANNPAVSAYVESRKIFASDGDVIVVSLGCGAKPTSYPDWSHWGLLHWASPANGVPILEVILDSQAAVVEHQMSNLLVEGKSYFRLQFSLIGAGDARIDDVSERNLDMIVGAAKSYLTAAGGQSIIDQIVQAI